MQVNGAAPAAKVDLGFAHSPPISGCSVPAWAQGGNMSVFQLPVTAHNLRNGLYSLVPIPSDAPVLTPSWPGRKFSGAPHAPLEPDTSNQEAQYTVTCSPGTHIMFGPECDKEVADISFKGTQLKGHRIYVHGQYVFILAWFSTMRL